MRSGNPVLSNDTFIQFGRTFNRDNTMTMNGTAAKTCLLLLLTFLTAGWTWFSYLKGNTAFVSGAMWVGIIGGMITAFITIFKMHWAPLTAPIYALLEGLFLGGISVIFNEQYPGIAIQAISLTFAVMALMLFLYISRIIQVTDSLRMGIVAATGGVALVYFVAIILGFFGVQVPFIFENGLFGILFSLVVVGIAAMNLVLDFDFIDRGSKSGAPKFMEWYGAFALMVTLVWLYIEILRLLSKLRSR
ncbi:Bax inhibitor-1/YccA family protein [Chlamydiales bacterium]|nr:Bax inhibitor-1/YccA family protein [Chlamydiales bacterium]